MKLHTFAIPMLAVSAAAFVMLSEEPFQYKYEIVANSNSAQDVLNLYSYKEKLITHYEKDFMPLDKKTLETKLINDIQSFAFVSDIKARYAYGTIVLLVGDAKGYTLSGNLKTDSCDETVIRTKVFIFDLFFN